MKVEITREEQAPPPAAITLTLNEKEARAVQSLLYGRDWYATADRLGAGETMRQMHDDLEAEMIANGIPVVGTGREFRTARIVTV